MQGGRHSFLHTADGSTVANDMETQAMRIGVYMFSAALDLDKFLIRCHDLQAGRATDCGIRIDCRGILQFMQQALERGYIGLFKSPQHLSGKNL
jgi:hypothetical protein